jgi:hypothetical protein
LIIVDDRSRNTTFRAWLDSTLSTGSIRLGSKAAME